MPHYPALKPGPDRLACNLQHACSNWLQAIRNPIELDRKHSAQSRPHSEDSSTLLSHHRPHPEGQLITDRAIVAIKETRVNDPSSPTKSISHAVMFPWTTSVAPAFARKARMTSHASCSEENTPSWVFPHLGGHGRHVDLLERLLHIASSHLRTNEGIAEFSC